MKSGLILPNIPIPLGVKKLFPPPPVGSVLYLPGYPPLGSTITDFSGYANHGTITGATRAKNTQGADVLVLDGTDDKLQITSNTSLQITGALTISLWIKFTTFARIEALAGKESGANEYYFYKYNDGRLFFIHGAETLQFAPFFDAGDAGVWKKITVVRDPVAAKVYAYKNAVQPVVAQAYTGTPVATTIAVRIGLRNDDAADYLGQIGFPITILPSARTSAQETSFFQQERSKYGV